MKNLSFFAIFLVSTFFIMSSTSCSKDDEKTKACTNFPVLDGEITINGQKQKLSVAQLIALSDNYSFQLGSISDDCNKQTIFNISIELSTGGKIGGTYPIRSITFGENIATGGIISQTISPITQTFFEFESGTVKVTDLGSKKFSFDISATDTLGEKYTLVLTHQF